MRTFFQRSFKRQLLLGILLVSVLPVLLSSLFLIRSFTYRISLENERKDRQQIESLAQTVEALLGDEEQILLRLSERERLGEALQSGYGSRTDIYRFLYAETGIFRQRTRFDLYSREGICRYSTGAGMYERNLPTYWGSLRAAAQAPEAVIYTAEQEDGENVLRLTRAVMDQDGRVGGYAAATLLAGDFDDIISPIMGGQESVLLLNSFLEPVYRYGRTDTEGITAILREQALGQRERTKSYEGNRLYFLNLGYGGLSILLLRPMPFSEETIASMYRISIMLSLVSIVLSLLMAGVISNRFSEPVQELNRAMHAVRRGELETHVETKRRDELGELTESFNVMTSHLRRYMQQQIAQQKELNEVQIAMMQAQLNPHFLYNTLDTMKWIAKANKVPEIATLSQRLAKILRTSISSAQFITVAEEISLVESYSEIQRIRFSGRFEIHCAVPEELKRERIPKLIIQPIVENAVIHGLRETDSGVISVVVSGEEEMLCILVTDNGIGISEEAVQLLMIRDKEKRKGHIGLYNVDSILRMYYGEEYGLQVRNREEGGTEVRMRIPMHRIEIVNEGK